MTVNDIPMSTPPCFIRQHSNRAILDVEFPGMVIISRDSPVFLS